MGTGKKKIEIKKITKETSRMVTFSKRRKGLFKKAEALQNLTGANVAIVVFSPAGKLYSCGDAGLFNAALERWSGRCSNDNGASSSNGWNGEVVGCGDGGGLLVCGGTYEGGFRGASSSTPAAAADVVVSNADMTVGCNGVDLSCCGGFEIASSSVDMIGCNGVDAAGSATSSADMRGYNGMNVGCYGGFESTTPPSGCATEEASNSCWNLFPVESATSSADMRGYNGVNVGCYGGSFESTTPPSGCATDEALNSLWNLLPVEAYFEVQDWNKILQEDF